MKRGTKRFLPCLIPVKTTSRILGAISYPVLQITTTTKTIAQPTYLKQKKYETLFDSPRCRNPPRLWAKWLTRLEAITQKVEPSFKSYC
jgi:hypothetical protein